MKNFQHAKARQPEIIRAIQKDSTYTKELSEDLSDILRITGTRNWIKYNNICNLIAEIVYHGFASVNNLQTLGEEYTGIVQIDSKYINIPSKITRLISIILEFGGDMLYLKILKKLEKEIQRNEEIIPEAKIKILSIVEFMKKSSPFIKVLHKTFFYFGSNKFHLSKRITGINYILIRHWMKPDHSLYGYKILGALTFLQLTISLILSGYDLFKENRNTTLTVNSDKQLEYIEFQNMTKCLLCLNPTKNTTATPCGHLYCWQCILDWLDEKDECPICRENVKKSNIIQLQNFL